LYKNEPGCQYARCECPASAEAEEMRIKKNIVLVGSSVVNCSQSKENVRDLRIEDLEAILLGDIMGN
jgi:hypothetical protein